MANEGLEYEIIENKLTKEKSYCAKTYPATIYTTSMLLARMISKGRYKQSEYEGFFRELKDIFFEVMSEGNSISISKILKFVPVVKGSFDNDKDGYQQGRNYIDIKATVSKPFVKKIEGKLEVNKIARPNVRAKIKNIVNTRTRENELCKHFSNTISGNFFIFFGYEFKGIEVRNCINPDESFFIEKENLNYPEFTNVGFSFVILYSLELPAWLTDGLEIFFNLVYSKTSTVESTDKGKDYSSEDFKTRWKEL